VCQVPLKVFEGSQAQQTQAAVSFMVDIAKVYCEGKLQKDQLHQARDDKLVAMGLRPPKRGRTSARQPMDRCSVQVQSKPRP